VDCDRSSPRATAQPVGVAVSSQENGLEEKNRRGPNRGRAAEPGQEHLGDDRLCDEKEAGADEDRDDPEHEKG